MNFEVLFFVSCYTVLLGIVSFIYFSVGYKRGIKDTLLSMRVYEPQAVDNAIKKIQEKNNAEFE